MVYADELILRTFEYCHITVVCPPGIKHSQIVYGDLNYVCISSLTAKKNDEKNKNKSRQITALFFIKYMHRLQQIIPEVMTKEDTNPTTLLLIRQVKSLVLLLLPLLMMRL